nr:MAG TPA: hypothetical protein [Caudoviricetes sp.]
MTVLKIVWIGQSAAKPRTEEGSTTKRPASDWRGLRWAPRTGEDIVCALLKW